MESYIEIELNDITLIDDDFFFTPKHPNRRTCIGILNRVETYGSIFLEFHVGWMQIPIGNDNKAYTSEATNCPNEFDPNDEPSD